MIRIKILFYVVFHQPNKQILISKYITTTVYAITQDHHKHSTSYLVEFTLFINIVTFSSQPRVLDLFLHHQQLKTFLGVPVHSPPFNYE